MANILVVDDDVVTLKVASLVLKKAGHTVSTAENGHAALEICSQESFDLVISDANMPGGISGFNLVSTLRKNPRFSEIPIMFLTGRREKHDVVQAVKSGADDYSVKPIDPAIFLAKIEALLESRSGKHSFSKTPLRRVASWPLPLEISGLSEQGLIFHSPVQLAVNTKMKLESEFYPELGINPPQLRIVSCVQSDETDAKFVVTASFIGLTESEHKLIRLWCISNSPLKSKKIS